MSDNVTPLFKEVDETDELTQTVLTLPDTDGTSDPEPDEAEYHAILKVWQHMLDPEHQNRHRPPTADWCAVMRAKWPFLVFADCGVVQREYFKIFDIGYEILDQIFRDNPETFEVDSREDDIENKELYVHFLQEMQRALLVYQSEWSHEDPEAGAKMAALGEAQESILGQKGIASYLGVIQLPFTEEEQLRMDQELQEFRESLEV